MTDQESKLPEIVKICWVNQKGRTEFYLQPKEWLESRPPAVSHATVTDWTRDYWYPYFQIVPGKADRG